MATAEEAATGRTPLGASLKAGLDVLSYNQTITFNLYVRMVMPLDGFVFWVKASLLVPTPQSGGLAQSLTVMGSMHNVTEQKQGEEENFSNVQMLFTSEEPVQDFNRVGPGFLYIGDFDGGRFAFSSRGTWYQQANLWHYVGSTVNSVMQTQVIDSAEDITGLADRVIVSNSLPAWLKLNNYAPTAYPIPLPTPAFQLYPSFLSPSNAVPPFGVIHIDPAQTLAEQQVAVWDNTMSRFQLARDRVEVALWGCNNDLASAWLDNIVQYTLDIGDFGLINMPIIQDDKRPQVEYLAIAQKKRIVFEVSYNQFAMRNIARQLILSAFMTIQTSDVPVSIYPPIPPVLP